MNAALLEKVAAALDRYTREAARFTAIHDLGAFYGFDWAEAEQRLVAAQLPPAQGQQQIRNRFVDLLVDMDPFQHITPTCPNCFGQDKRHLTMKDNPVIVNSTDGLSVMMMCIHSATVAGNACGHKARLHDFLSPQDRTKLVDITRDWMCRFGSQVFSAQYTNTPATMPPVPAPGLAPIYKQMIVLLNIGGSGWACPVTMPVKSMADKIDDNEARKAAELKYKQAIEEHIKYGHPLPRGVQAVQLGLGYWLNQSGPGPQITEEMLQKTFAKAFPPDCPGTKPSTEAEKPEGTRDVEKYQRQERDKQLRELFGC